MKLKKGDLIVTHTRGFVPWIIRRLTRSEWSHVAIYVGNRMMVEALGAGVCKRSVMIYEGRRRSRYCKAFRPETTGEIKRRACNIALGNVGRKYDYSAIWGIYLAIKRYRLNRQNAKEEASRFFCSELVATSYSVAGHDLFNTDTIHLTCASPGDCVIGAGTWIAGWPESA